MKKLLLFFLLSSIFKSVQAQKYFQQEVNYRINVTLDDVANTVKGDIIIEYTNNSPNKLDSIWMHLWGNAFKNQNSAFAKQKLRSGDTKFYFAKDSDLGYYSDLDFTVYGQKIKWGYDKSNPDIAVLHLAQPLESGGKIVLKTPFTLKVPASWSRLGHVGTSYQMTQWFPKPAVYDAQGWHPIPYLDQGEFYSEFGSFDVNITLPENYVVGATGVLQTESEVKFLEQKVAETQELIKNGFAKTEEFPPSATATKTLHFTAEKVHDFAWFADKRFHVVKDEAVLPSGKKIPTWGMFTNAESDLWVRGAEYVKRAVEFYSEHVGEYPWPQATAVHSALSAGGGMEYPMITVIGNSNSASGLDDVITHEVGHNWFYGLLASNERDHPWMDEGMNSYYEYRYMRQYYGSRADFGMPKFLTNMIDGDLYEFGYLFQCRRRMDQAPETTSDDFSSINYGISAYVKPGSVFGHLEQYLGTAAFDRIMKKYYDQWHFKHPQPSDLQAIFEKESGKNLGWFFDGYLKSIDQLDYSLRNISGDAAAGYQVLVKNRGEIAAPFPITAYRDTVAVRTEWFEGFSGEKTVDFPATDCDRLVLDGSHATLDVYRKNNTIKTGGAFKTLEPVKLRLLGPFESSKNTTLNLMPIIGWNKYDGGMAGLLLHNGIVPARKFQYQLATMYGFNSKDLVGVANMQYNIFPKSEKIKQLSIGLNSKAFNYKESSYTYVDGAVSKELLQYRRIVPFVRLELMRAPNEKFYQEIQLRSLFIQQQSLVGDTAGYSLKWNDNTINEISWELGDRRSLNPYSLRLALEQGNFNVVSRNYDYIKLSVEGNMDFNYERKRKIYTRIFFGSFLKNGYRNGFRYSPVAFNLTAEGYNDYRFDDYYFGRTENSGGWTQQIHQREGGFKVPVGNTQSENAGRSNNFILAINLKADLPQDLPLKLPLKPYFDFGYFDDTRPISSDLSTTDKIWWQGGAALEFGKGIFGVYIPIVSSKNLRGTDNLPGLYDQSGRDKFLERIAFTLDLAKLNPWKLAEGIQF